MLMADNGKLHPLIPTGQDNHACWQVIGQGDGQYLVGPLALKVMEDFAAEVAELDGPMVGGKPCPMHD